MKGKIGYGFLLVKNKPRTGLNHFIKRIMEEDNNGRKDIL